MSVGRPVVVPIATKRRALQAPTSDTRKRFTTSAVDALPLKATRYVAWDVEPKGFGVRVSPDATKTYIFKFRTKAGRVRWATIGRVGGKLSLEQARDKAYRMRGVVADGKDPLREIDTARGAVTLKDAATRWLEEHVTPKRKPRTVASYKQILDTHIIPKLGAVPIHELATDDVVKLHYQMRATKTHANRAIAVLGSLLTWTMKAKLRAAGVNPCKGVERYAERQRRRYLTAEEYARLGAVLRDARTTGTIAPAPLTAIELLLLTGARPDEIASLKWAHVHLDAATLELPDSKTGAKTIPLSPPAVALLKRWPKWRHSAYVFPGRRRGRAGEHMHGSTLSHVWADLRAAADLDDCRLYDACRHSYASMAVSRHGLSLPQIGAQLGHARAETTQRYAHLHATVARQHATAIGGDIAKALKTRKARR